MVYANDRERCPPDADTGGRGFGVSLKQSLSFMPPRLGAKGLIQPMQMVLGQKGDRRDEQ